MSESKPSVDASVDASKEHRGLASEELRLKGLRPTLTALFAVVLLVGGVVAGAWYLETEEHLTRVVVAVEGGSGPCRENVGLRLAFLLQRHGLDVRFANLSLASAMQRQEAPHGIQITLEHTDRTPLVEGMQHAEVLVRARTRTTDEAERAPSEVRFLRETPTLDRTLLEAGLAGADALASVLASELLESDAIDSYLEAGPSPHDMDRFEAIERARRGVEQYATSRARFEELCRETSAEMRADGLQCLTAECGNEYLVEALSPDAALLRIETADPVFVLGSTSDVQRSERPERFVIAHVNGTRQEVLATSNLFSSASLSRNGRYLAYVEIGGDGSAILVRRDLETAESRIVHRVGAPARIFFPEISPDGRYIAFTHRAFNAGEVVLYVAAVEDEQTWEPAEYGVQARWVELDLDGLSESLLAVTIAAEVQPAIEATNESETESNDGEADGDSAIDESEIDEEEVLEVPVRGRQADAALPPLTHIALVRPGPTEGEVVRRLGGVERHVGTVAGVIDNRLIATAATPLIGCEVAIWSAGNGGDGDAQSTEAEATGLAFVLLEVCVAYPNVGHDGALYADAPNPNDGNSEVARIDIETGGVIPITNNTIRDRWVRPARGSSGRDGQRVFFERIPQRRYARHPVAGVCWADVQSPNSDGS